MSDKVDIDIVGEDDKLKAALTDALSALKEFGTGTDVATSGMQKMHFGFDVLTKGADLAARALKGVVEWMIEAGQKAIDKEESWLRFNAVIRANAGASQVTREQLELLAKVMLDFNIATEGATKDAEVLLLTFQNVKGDNFIRTIKAAADLAAVMGGDLASATFTLGRALEDPESGLGSLGRAGIKFTQSQKDMIKALLDTNLAMEAQSVILDIIESKIGGVAAEMDGSAKDAYEEMLNTINKVQVSIGKEFLPLLRDLSPVFNEVAEYATAAGKAIAEAFRAEVAGAQGAADSLTNLKDHLSTVLDVMQVLQISVKFIYAGLMTVYEVLTEIATAALDLGTLLVPDKQWAQDFRDGTDAFRQAVRTQWGSTMQDIDDSMKADWWSKTVKKNLVKPQAEEVAQLFSTVVDDATREMRRERAEAEADFDNLLKESKKIKEEKVKEEKDKKSSEKQDKENNDAGQFIGLEELHKKIAEAAARVKQEQKKAVADAQKGNQEVKNAVEDKGIRGFKNNPFNFADPNVNVDGSAAIERLRKNNPFAAIVNDAEAKERLRQENENAARLQKVMEKIERNTGKKVKAY